MLPGAGPRAGRRRASTTSPSRTPAPATSWCGSRRAASAAATSRTSGSAGSPGPGAEPMCLGHEIAGTVDWVGADVASGPASATGSWCSPGATSSAASATAAREGGLTPLLLVTDADRDRLHPVPDDLRARRRRVRRAARGRDARGRPGRRASRRRRVRVRLRPIGLAAIATLVDRGHDRVVAVDLSPTRLDARPRARRAGRVRPGADDLWARARATPRHRAVHVRTDAGDGGVHRGLRRRPGDRRRDRPRAVGARLAVVALHYDPVPTSYLMILMKELTIRGSIEYPPRFDDAIDLLARRDLSGLLTHRYPLTRSTDALSCSRARRTAARCSSRSIGTSDEPSGQPWATTRVRAKEAVVGHGQVPSRAGAGPPG